MINWKELYINLVKIDPGAKFTPVRFEVNAARWKEQCIFGIKSPEDALKLHKHGVPMTINVHVKPRFGAAEEENVLAIQVPVVFVPDNSRWHLVLKKPDGSETMVNGTYGM